MKSKLNLPPYSFTVRRSGNQKPEILDVYRKKYVTLTPEEWVRQNFLRFLVEERGYPVSLIAVEKGLVVNRQPKRFDAVVYGSDGMPWMLLEFKSSDVAITQKVFEQIALYNQLLKVNFLVVSNGMNHYACKVDFESGEIVFLKEIPHYQQLQEEYRRR